MASLGIWLPSQDSCHVAMVELQVSYLESMVPAAACEMAVLIRTASCTCFACRALSLRPPSTSCTISTCHGTDRYRWPLSTTADPGSTCSTAPGSPYPCWELSIIPPRPTIYPNRVGMNPDLPLIRLPVHNPPSCFHSVSVLHPTSLISYAT